MDLVQNLTTEIQLLTVECDQTSLKNDALKKDNASLLQRWIDKMNDEVEFMNRQNGASTGGEDAP